MDKPSALLLAAGLLLLCATAATARRALLQGAQPPNIQCDEWDEEDFDCKLSCGAELDCEEDDSGVKCEFDPDLGSQLSSRDDFDFRCGVANGQVDLASCDSNKARIPSECMGQVDELLNAWRPRDD